MTRWIWILMGILLVSTSVGAAFSDIPPGHWAYEAVETLVKAGLLEPGNVYNGEEPVTRYEMALLLADLLQLVEPSQTVPGLSGVQRELLDRLQIEFEEELRRINEKYYELRQQAAGDRGRFDDLQQQQEKASSQIGQIQRDLSGIRTEFTGISAQSAKLASVENEMRELREELEAQAAINRRLYFAIGVLGAVLLLLQIS